ncbi:2-phosphosulfolactate phosphatase [Longirhabdus pacifica]|uniref:2-phosphosulfolactate phosphatase n=1 Tax=Longirhabdus pacifica TaxID=2305227 RepID=UPI001008B72E|nr:2-phosphosulfolactate phosphatase [Longirhabdus pacifica]
MHVEVIPTITEAKSDQFHNKTAIVIDVLHTTSTITTALEHQCSEIIPVETVSQALKLQKHKTTLLCGERYGKKVTHFDLGNSPLEYEEDVVKNKKIVITTTNGTRAIQKSLKATHILAGSFLNGRACAQAAKQLKRDIIMVCAGTQDEFSIEDGLCAGFLISELEHCFQDHIHLNDFALAMKAAYQQEKNNLLEFLLESKNGSKVQREEKVEELKMLTRHNCYNTVPYVTDDRMVKFPF